MKKKTNVFLRSFMLSGTLVVCIFIMFCGTAKAYENTVKNSTGEYRKAVSFSGGVLRILDFEINVEKIIPL